MLRGLSPQPRLLWAIAIGAGLIALAPISPALIALAVLYHLGLALVVVRDLAQLPSARTFTARRILPEPFSLGEQEEVTVVVANAAARGLRGTVADHAPSGLSPHPREVAGTFGRDGTLTVAYTTSSPRRGAYRFESVDVQVARHEGWLRRQVRIPLRQEVAVFPNIVAIKRIQLTLRRGLRALAGDARGRRVRQPPSPGCATTRAVTTCAGSAGPPPRGVTGRWWSRSRPSAASR
jgi:uncharacterized protein (DUF58 family)